MVKNKVLSRPLPDASVPRNVFDKSKRVNMNLPFGAIVPCYHGVALAGSRWQCNINTFFRTAKVNTAAFPRLQMQTSFYAVPIRYLWSYWENFKLGINDYNSTALFPTQSGFVSNPDSVPFYNIKAIWDLIDNQDLWYDNLGYPWHYGATRLLDNLGYGRYTKGMSRGTDFDSFSQAMNLFKLAAYQKVYYDHFRNTAYESNDPQAYNLDWITLQAPTDDLIYLRKLLTLRYANYRKDYFQQIFPSLNYVNSTPARPITGLPSWIRGLAENDVQLSTGTDRERWHLVNGGDPNPNVAVSTNGVGSTLSAAGSIYHTHLVPNNIGYNVQSIRAAFALDKLLRSSAYAPKHVKDQYEARYGIKYSSRSSYESDVIGNFGTDIVIGEVTSTANTSASGGDQLGDIGGKGVGSSDPRKNHMISYNASEDCIIIGVCYAVPRTSYDSYRFDNWNMKLSQGDFFMPEFMNLGLKPVYRKELQYARVELDGSRQVYSQYDVNRPLGYQPPYMEYKCDIDENHGLFADHDSELAQFVVHTSDYQGSLTDGVDQNFFKVKPSDLDSIFVTAADGSEATDHLFGEITMTIPVNQNMSVHGQPSL